MDYGTSNASASRSGQLLYRSQPCWTPQTLVKNTTYNFSGYGNAVQLGYRFIPGNAGESVLNYTGWSINYMWITPVELTYWINNERLSFPFTTVAIVIDQIQLTVNGTFLKNIPNFDPHNLLKCLSPDFVLINGTVPQLSYSVNNVSSPYEFSNPYEDLNASNYINQGTYLFTFNFTFTPIFESGPYHVNGNPQHLDFRWVQTYIT